MIEGVRIGTGNIIAAGAVVTKDVPPNSLYRYQIIPVMTPISFTNRENFKYHLVKS